MKLKNAIPSLAAAVLAAVPIANAQNATTDPVGFVSYTVNALSDQSIATPMQQSSVFSGTASSVSGAIVSATGLTALSGVNYLLVTSGSATGKWESIVSSSSGSVTLEGTISGFTSNNTFVIKPFWTLGSLFPNGGNIPSSSSVFSPESMVLLYSPNSEGTNYSSTSQYFYFAGGDGFEAGWYDANDPFSGVQNNLIVSPETYFTIRNQSASPFTVTFVGSVPTNSFALDVITRSIEQDNLVYNRFPSNVTLGNSGLTSVVSPSSSVFSPQELVLMFALNNSGQNVSSSSQYFYYAGGDGFEAGWYDANDPFSGIQNDVVIPAGSAFIIRKSPNAPSITSWNPAPPYNLQ